MGNEKETDNVRSVGQEAESEILYRVRSSQIPNAIAVPVALTVLALIVGGIVTFYDNKDAVTATLRADLARSEDRTRGNLDRLGADLRDDITDLKVATKENRNQIVILWQRVSAK